MDSTSMASGSSDPVDRDAIYDEALGGDVSRHSVRIIERRADGKETLPVPSVLDSDVESSVGNHGNLAVFGVDRVHSGKALGSMASQSLIDAGFSAGVVNQALKRAALLRTPVHEAFYSRTVQSSESESDGEKRKRLRGGVVGMGVSKGDVRGTVACKEVDRPRGTVKVTQKLLRGTYEVCGVHPIMDPAVVECRGVEWWWTGIRDTCVYVQEEDILLDRLRDVFDMEDDDVSITSDSYTVSSKFL